MDKSQSSKFTGGARWVALLLLPALLLIGISNGMAAPPPPEPGLQMAPLRPGALEPLPPRTGFIPPPMDLSHLTGQTLPKSVEAKQLPDIWDWRTQSGGRVTPAKDQGACGSCYAFGAIGNIESKLLMDGEGTFDFSENNAKECNWRELNDFQYPNPGDYWGSCDGGNYQMLVTLFSTKGTVLESCDPYQASDVTCNTTCTYQKTLLDWRMISADTIPNTDVLKQYIYDNGPVTVSMYADDTQGFDGTYDGSYTFDYVTPGSSTNHSVLIVGWSNNLPPVTGNKAQAADGWIVKNSWGTDWGDNGYFYMTYGAGNLGMWASFMHDWQDYDANGDLWYYDDDGWWTSFGETGGSNTTAWGLAKFIPDKNTNVTRVEFWTADATTDVDVYVYDDFDGSTLSNLLASKLNLSFGEAGYHSVALDSPLAATSGDDVIAVVKFTNESNGFPVVADPHGTIESGRTYISLSGSSGSWTDMGTISSGGYTGYDGAIRLRTSTSVSEAPNVGITKQVVGTDLAPGDPVTFTLAIANSGNAVAAHVVVTDVVPSEVLNPSFDSTLDITPTGAISYVWDVEPLWVGASGVISIYGWLDPGLESDFSFTNMAAISDPEDDTPGNNTSSVTVGESEYMVYLPVIAKCSPLKPALSPISNPDGDGIYTVRWSWPSCAPSSPSYYQLQGDDNSQFSSPSSFTVYGTTFEAYSPSPATYYWRVRAYLSGTGWSEWSGIQSVKVTKSLAYVWIDNDTGGNLTVEIVGIEKKSFSTGTHYWRSITPGRYTYKAWARCGSGSWTDDFVVGMNVLTFWCGYSEASASEVILGTRDVRQPQAIQDFSAVR